MPSNSSTSSSGANDSGGSTMDAEADGTGPCDTNTIQPSIFNTRPTMGFGFDTNNNSVI